MEAIELAPNIFKPRNDWGLIALKHNRNIKPYKVFIQDISNVIKNEIGVSPLDDVDYRGRNYVLARQLLMVMLLRYTTKNQSAIGKIAGGKDHATVIHARRAINNLCETDKKFNEQFFRINAEVLNFLKPF
jgi:chromosomal replication initiator protein